MKKDTRKPLHKQLWCKIRYWQNLNDVTNDQLASYLQVKVRTLSEYDKTPENITLKQIEHLLTCNNLDFEDIFR